MSDDINTIETSAGILVFPNSDSEVYLTTLTSDDGSVELTRTETTEGFNYDLSVNSSTEVQVDSSGNLIIDGESQGLILTDDILSQSGYLYVNSGEISVQEISVDSSSSSSGNDQVAVNSSSTPGYLEDVLVSDSDEVTLTIASSQMRINFNTELTSDPKLETITESQINTETSNYGSYAVATWNGYDKVVWEDYNSVSYLNAICYQMMRLADAQGTVTKVNLAVIGSPAWEDPVPMVNIAIFDLSGNLLGSTGLKFLNEDFENNSLVTFDMVEAETGSLQLERNQRYYIQVWSCGLQIAGMERSDQSSYTYDYTLRQNLQSSQSGPEFLAIDSTLYTQASVIPFLNFGATSLNS